MARILAIALAAASLGSASFADAPDAPDAPPAPLMYFAGMAGQLTTDRDSEGGNPFASALVEVWRDEGLGLRDFGAQVAAATMRYSGGWQSPQVPKRAPNPDWRFAAEDGAAEGGEDRVALVLVNADYSKSGVSSLPGAAFDAERIPDALEALGFEVTLVLDRSGEEVDAALAAFADRSAVADVALVYHGGHGVQPGRDVYWIYGDYPDPESRAALATHALKVAEAGAVARARKLNFVFYAACRDNPFLR